MRKKSSLILVLVLALFGCATRSDYYLNAFYESKNNELHLISKLLIFKSGDYSLCTTTSEHKKESDSEKPAYYCVSGKWRQINNTVNFTAEAMDGKLLYSTSEGEGIELLEKGENLANPSILYILNSSGKTLSHFPNSSTSRKKEQGWTNYEAIKHP